MSWIVAVAAARVLTADAQPPFEALQAGWDLEPWTLPSVSIGSDSVTLGFEAPGRAPTTVRLGPPHTDGPFSARCTGPDCDPLRAEVLLRLDGLVTTDPWREAATAPRKPDRPGDPGAGERRPGTPTPWFVFACLGLAVVGVGVAGWTAPRPAPRPVPPPAESNRPTSGDPTSS